MRERRTSAMSPRAAPSTLLEGFFSAAQGSTIMKRSSFSSFLASRVKIFRLEQTTISVNRALKAPGIRFRRFPSARSSEFGGTSAFPVSPENKVENVKEIPRKKI